MVDLTDDRTRRDFLRGTAWMGLAALTAGAAGKGLKLTDGASGAPMQGYHDKPMDEIRIGFVGVGSRGTGSVRRLAILPGVRVTAICDLIPERVAAANSWRVKNGFPKAKEYTGVEGYKRLCADPDVDVVYSVTNWVSHHKINMCAMLSGKHMFTEMPGALTVDDCWEEVETSEKTRRHCMMLENCCYGESELLALNMVRMGLFGEIVHGEAGYIHDQRNGWVGPGNYKAGPVAKDVKPPAKTVYAAGQYYGRRHGNYYPTHGLGPVARIMNINHGDRLDYLVSLESKQASLVEYGKGRYPGGWQSNIKVVKGDMNQSLIRTMNGRSILLQHDVFSPRPYNRLLVLTGTHGEFRGYPTRQFTYEREFGSGETHNFFSPKKTADMSERLKHPLWRAAGEISKKVGGHGGIDFLMDLRWTYCLRNGLPLDMDVYDMAAWSCLCELTERSVNARSAAVDIPDFTRGAWKTSPAFAPETFDPGKLHLDQVKILGVGAQQTV